MPYIGFFLNGQHMWINTHFKIIDYYYILYITIDWLPVEIKRYDCTLHFFTFLRDSSKSSTLMFAISTLKLGLRVSHSLSVRPPVVWLTLAQLSDRCSLRHAAAANHIYQRSTQTWAQRTTRRDVSQWFLWYQLYETPSTFAAQLCRVFLSKLWICCKRSLMSVLNCQRLTT